MNYYTINSGDTLTAIARRYGVPVQELQRANSIADPNRINAGATLNIPALAAVKTAPLQFDVLLPPANAPAGVAAASPAGVPWSSAPTATIAQGSTGIGWIDSLRNFGAVAYDLAGKVLQVKAANRQYNQGGAGTLPGAADTSQQLVAPVAAANPLPGWLVPVAIGAVVLTLIIATSSSQGKK